MNKKTTQKSHHNRTEKWYLDIMSPNTKGGKFAWLDPTSIYINGDAFHDLLRDLLTELREANCDVVAGIDAMGFVRLRYCYSFRCGFLPIRKAGKLCVETDNTFFSNYTGQTQKMEMRLPAFNPGTKVLLVDQWVETGGTMDGAIRLVKRQSGIIVGLVAIAMEDNEQTAAYREQFRCVTAVKPFTELQKQCNDQYLNSFEKYTADMAFPKNR